MLPTFHRQVIQFGAGLLLLVLLAMLCSVSVVVAWEFTAQWAAYELTGQAGPLLGAAVAAAEAPLPGIFLTGPGGRLHPLGDFRWGSGSNTFCELYVEQRLGLGNQGVTAYAAGQRFAQLGLLHPGPPPAGALVYFGPSPDNEGEGHVGIAEEGGQFRSVTTSGLADAPLAGWRAPYLGWVDPASVTTDRFGHPVTPKTASRT